LERRFGYRGNVRVDKADLADPGQFDRWKDEGLDTVFCSNVLEHLEPDEQVLKSFYRTLTPGGHCIIVVPAGRWLYTGLDRALGHRRRYTAEELRRKMVAAGFAVVFTRQFSKLGSIGWMVSSRLLGRQNLSARQMVWFDRLWPVAKILDYLLPVPGMSLIMVGRKPATSVRKQPWAMDRRQAA
jgi:SAM-dependent methyltransferase